MKVYSNYNLLSCQTFKMNVKANYFAEITSLEELKYSLEFLKKNPQPFLVLGGGSNILFTKDFEGLIIKNSLKGKEMVKEDEEHVWIKVRSGENWHELVNYCVESEWNGIENLALIPGTVGAAPIQNIGAYGVELKEVLDSVEALHLATQQICSFSPDECELGYRESIFKKKYKNQFIITAVTLKLNKKPILNFSYSDVKKYLENHQLEPSIKNIFHAVIHIRKEKLPDPQEIGNAGSFFKNPYISRAHFLQLKEQYPHLPGFPIEENIVKIPAAWLIEQCGWKGYRENGFGVHHKQPLVLVNFGNANGEQIFLLAQKIMKSVKEKFDIQLEPEVNIL